MKFKNVKEIERAIYKKKFCFKAHYRNFKQFPDGNYQTDTIYCIDGKDVKTNEKIIGKLSSNVNYIFYYDALHRLHPVRVSPSTKTLENIERGRKRFWHLRPESEICTFKEYYKR